ncbi:MAG: hypothetical protein HY235_08835 [Acidobacteria bacterium]|nr:hypothetical protein [Acidobacteriota bacterium]
MSDWAMRLLSHPLVQAYSLQLLKRAEVSRISAETAASSAIVTFYFGHGEWNRLYSIRTDLLDFENIRAAAGKLLVAIACRSARELGLFATAEAGVLAYIGFSHDLILPGEDHAGLFEDAVRAGILSLLGGSTVREATRRIKNKFTEAAVYYATRGRNHQDAVLASAFAHWNARYTLFHGDPQTRLANIDTPQPVT